MTFDYKQRKVLIWNLPCRRAVAVRLVASLSKKMQKIARTKKKRPLVEKHNGLSSRFMHTTPCHEMVCNMFGRVPKLTV